MATLRDIPQDRTDDINFSGVQAEPTQDQALRMNREFNEQFNRRFQQQQLLLEQNPKFLRTRQSLEGERRNNVGDEYEFRPFRLYQEDTLRPDKTKLQAFQGQVECDSAPVAMLFMSEENTEYLQQAIRYQIYKISNEKHIIDKQSTVELQLIMRSIYYQYGKNLPQAIRQQVEELNDLVIQECVSRILSQIQAHVHYLYDASTTWTPISRPVNVSSAGRKTLPSVTSTFFS